MKEDSISFEIPMVPVAKGRPRMTCAGFAFTPAKTRVAEATVKQYAQAAAAEKQYPVFGENPIEVSICFTFDRPKSRKGELYKATRPDIDNLVKSILDPLNGIMWKDDGQVVFLTASKVWGLSPSVKITIWRLANGTK